MPDEGASHPHSLSSRAQPQGSGSQQGLSLPPSRPPQPSLRGSQQGFSFSWQWCRCSWQPPRSGLPQQPFPFPQPQPFPQPRPFPQPPQQPSSNSKNIQFI